MDRLAALQGRLENRDVRKLESAQFYWGIIDESSWAGKCVRLALMHSPAADYS
ncbi:MAG: hypothetical protein KME19_06540 [Microcoleus vaginatus WJT46-NPBG5]|nr:hypothetical protein [Microcoleus vaginatus WJT46-NPBG5]